MGATKAWLMGLGYLEPGDENERIDLNDDVFARLRAPFPPEDLEWRPGNVSPSGDKALMLPYITARAVMDRLDDVLGPAGWSDRYRRETEVGWVCTLTIFLGDREIVHEDGADETNFEKTKGGISDALKRAAVKLGIGRYLYYLPRYYAPGQGNRNNFRPLKTWKPLLPDWAKPGGSGRPSAPMGNPMVEDAPPIEDYAPPPLVQPPPSSDPSSPLPSTPPPIDLNQVVGFGKHKEKPWAWIAMGSVDGQRRQWLHWYVRESDTANKPNPPQSYLKAKALLEWLEPPLGEQPPSQTSNMGWLDDDSTPF